MDRRDRLLLVSMLMGAIAGAGMWGEPDSVARGVVLLGFLASAAVFVLRKHG